MIRSIRWLTGLTLVMVLSTHASAQTPALTLLNVTAASTTPDQKGVTAHSPSRRSIQRAPIEEDFNRQIARVKALGKALQILIAEGKVTLMAAIARKDFEQAKKLRAVLVALVAIMKGSGISLGENGSFARTPADVRPLAHLESTVEHARNQWRSAQEVGPVDTESKPFMNNVVIHCLDVERRLFGTGLGDGPSVDRELDAVLSAAVTTGRYARPGSLGGQYATLTHSLATRASR